MKVSKYKSKQKNYSQVSKNINKISWMKAEKSLLVNDDSLEFLTAEETIDILPSFIINPEVPTAYWQPEHELWRAVLQNAIDSYEKQLCALSEHRLEAEDEEELRELIAWFCADTDTIGSFYFICDILFLEYEPILKHVKRLIDKYSN